MSDTRANWMNLIGLVLMGAVAVVIGVVALSMSRDGLCHLVAYVPAASCGSSNPPDRTALVAVVPIVTAFVLLAYWRRNLLMAWQKDVNEGGGAFPGLQYWPVSILRGISLIFSIVLVLTLTAKIDGDTTGPVLNWIFFPFVLVTIWFALRSSKRAKRRALDRSVREVTAASLQDAMANGGGWCVFDGVIVGPAVAGAELATPLSGEPSVAWKMWANVITVEQERQTIPGLSFEAHLRNDVMFGADGVKVNETMIGSDEARREYTVLREISRLTATEIAAQAVPFEVAGADATIVVRTDAISLRIRSGGEHKINRKRNAEWFDYISNAIGSTDKANTKAAVGALHPGERVTITGCVFSHQSTWYVGSLAVGGAHLAEPISQELSKRLEAEVRQR